MIQEFVLLLALRTFFASSFVGAHVKLKFPVPMSATDHDIYPWIKSACSSDVAISDMIIGNDPAGPFLVDTEDGPTAEVYTQLKNMSSSLRAGTNVTISWSVSYPHNGGWEIGIYRIVPQHNGNSDGMGEPVLCSQDFGCVDGTATSTEIHLPSDMSCDVCLVRLQRQALEVHDGQGMYRSCAVVSIAGSVVDVCHGCSGHGTCVQGKCMCYSSEQAGYYYGTYCEMENECEVDQDCGEGGVCQDTKSADAPRKQCYCRTGWFGPEFVTPGGKSMRKCTLRSTMSVGNLSEWETEYPYVRRSTPGSGISVYWKINVKEGFIEYAIAAYTDAWAALGLRPESITGYPLPTMENFWSNGGNPASGNNGLQNTGIPDLEPESPQAAADLELTDPLGFTRESPVETMPYNESEPESLPEQGPEKLGDADREKAAVEIEETVDEALPERYKGIDPEEQDPSVVAEPRGGNSAREFGVVSEDDTASELTCETSFSDAVKHPVENICTVPPVSKEAVTELQEEQTQLTRGRRLAGHLKAGVAEAEAEQAQASGPPPDAFLAEPAPTHILAAGACGALLTPTWIHPMVNLDTVIVTARGDTFRVYDAFAKSPQERPMPDTAFGGWDNILDAAGSQVEHPLDKGKVITLVKFRKPLETKDYSDYCYVPGVRYRVAYAYGQRSNRGAEQTMHHPPSSLETDTGQNKDFYQPLSLLYHGGGLNSVKNHDSRSSSMGIEFFSTTPEPACSASGVTADYTGIRYQCKLDLSSGASLHWTSKPSSGILQLGLEAPTVNGWVSLGFPDPQRGLVMEDALVVIGSPKLVKMYRLEGYSLAEDSEWPEDFIPGLLPWSLELLRTETSTIVRFEIQVGHKELEQQIPIQLITAYSRTSDLHNSKHSPGTNQAFMWTPVHIHPEDQHGHENSGCPLQNGTRWGLWVTHGTLMAAAWGVAMPAGILAARFCETRSSLYHSAITAAGLSLATAGWVLALASFGDLLDLTGDVGSRMSLTHSVLGILVMLLGFLLPISAIFNAPSNVQLRGWFRAIHFTVGYITCGGGAVNVALGLLVFRTLDGPCSPSWPGLLFAGWAAVYVAVWLIFEARKMLIKKAEIAKSKAAQDAGKGIQTAEEAVDIPDHAMSSVVDGSHGDPRLKAQSSIPTSSTPGTDDGAGPSPSSPSTYV